MSIKLNKENIQGSASFSEISQTHVVKFAPVNISEDGKEAMLITHPFKCRDFFIEAALSHYYKKRFAIYGFKIDCEKYDWISGSTSMLIKFPEKKHKDNFITNMPLLNLFENVNGIKITKVFPVEGEDLSVIIQGDNIWKTKGFLISFYTFLLKCLIFDIDHTSDKLWLFQIPPSTEKTRINDIGEERFSKFYQNFRKIIQIEGNVTGYPNELDIDVYDLHDNSGFVSIVAKSYSDFEEPNAYKEKIADIIAA